MQRQLEQIIVAATLAFLLPSRLPPAHKTTAAPKAATFPLSPRSIIAIQPL